MKKWNANKALAQFVGPWTHIRSAAGFEFAARLYNTPRTADQPTRGYLIGLRRLGRGR